MTAETHENKAPFTFEDAIRRRIKFTNEQKLKDDDFHESRIMFAFLDKDTAHPDGVLRYAVNDKRDHANWLHDTINMDSDAFEQTVRGYIRPLDGKPGIQRCIAYKGMSHAPTRLSEQHLASIIAVWQEKYPDADGLEIWTGCKIGEIGTIWPPVEHVFTIYKNGIQAFEETCWERYATHWLFTHGHTVHEMVRELQSLFEDTYKPDLDPKMISCLMREWESDMGFGGEIYACQGEFLENEYKLKDVMKNILPENEFKTYLSLQPYYMAPAMKHEELK